MSQRALIQRIRRKLAQDGEHFYGFGRGLPGFYVTDGRNNIVASYPVIHLESIGRELGVLAEYEEVRS